MYGSKAARLNKEIDLGKMLQYAIEDEYLARCEYEIAINKFGDEKPFSSIINSEVIHINWLKELFHKYELKVPTDESKKYLDVPDSFEDALEFGVKAEIDNIEMYNTFLCNNIPDDIRVVFTKLRDASNGHLIVLKRKLESIK